MHEISPSLYLSPCLSSYLSPSLPPSLSLSLSLFHSISLSLPLSLSSKHCLYLTLFLFCKDLIGDLDTSAAVYVDYNVDKDIVRRTGYRASLGNVIDTNVQINEMYRLL